MKKLMLAAIAAIAVTGVEAACKPGTPDVIETAWVYTWKFTGKTTDGVMIKGTSATYGTCTPGGSSTADCAIRVPASLKIQGYTYKCLPCCGDFTALADDGEAFYQTKPTKDLMVVTDKKKNFTEGLTIDFGHVIGKKAKDFELLGFYTATTRDAGEKYTFCFAGLGKYDLANTRISSVCGNFAGQMEVPHYHKYVAALKGCPEAYVWNCDASDYDGVPATVAYGSWSMKYNASASKKFLNNGALVKLPVK